MPTTEELANVAYKVAPELLSVDDSHKYSHGHALVLSGPSGAGGAARLAARAALRIGAGVVTIGCPPDARREHAAQLNAIMLRDLADADALRVVLTDDRINALCVGPALGLGAREKALVHTAVEHTGPDRRVVFDADALTLIAQDPELSAKLNDKCILTPHAGEFARLFPDLAARSTSASESDSIDVKIEATCQAASRVGSTVLFKGPDTVIANPDGRHSLHRARGERAAPWLATAGAGDVLAGFIAGLLARGLPMMQAAELAVWLHVECARSFGPGLIAEDLAEQLPTVLRALI